MPELETDWSRMALEMCRLCSADAVLKGTPIVPLHQDAIRRIVHLLGVAHDKLVPTEHRFMRGCEEMIALGLDGPDGIGPSDAKAVWEAMMDYVD